VTHGTELGGASFCLHAQLCMMGKGNFAHLLACMLALLFPCSIETVALLFGCLSAAACLYLLTSLVVVFASRMSLCLLLRQPVWAVCVSTSWVSFEPQVGRQILSIIG
jgi:acyl-CoA synthetase (AMP-forming)/AMP-acid ligase II